MYALRVDEARGRVVVTGQGGSAAQTIVYSSSGHQLWVARYSEADRQVFASDVAVDPCDGIGERGGFRRVRLRFPGPGL